ncbi:hypothetical protein J4Q44_G00159610 [Coregonus suidteri]|uniref:Uncharacterized protein n=1 Tax=Coregonus suidteri TaxID=861788 RepID=A0AAN8LU04_9TELE
MVTPLTQQCFNLVEMENSVLYCICGVEVITGFQFVRWLSRRTAVRVVLAMGLILCKISCVRCLIFLANPQGFGTPSSLWPRCLSSPKSLRKRLKGSVRGCVALWWVWPQSWAPCGSGV